MINDEKQLQTSGGSVEGYEATADKPVMDQKIDTLCNVLERLESSIGALYDRLIPIMTAPSDAEKACPVSPRETMSRRAEQVCDITDTLDGLNLRINYLIDNSHP